MYRPVWQHLVIYVTQNCQLLIVPLMKKPKFEKFKHVCIKEHFCTQLLETISF